MVEGAVLPGAENRSRFEKRQLESYRSWSNALAVFRAVAWRLLPSGPVSHVTPDATASSVLSSSQLKLLQQLLNMRKTIDTAGPSSLGPIGRV